MNRSEDLIETFQNIRKALLSNDPDALINLVAEDYRGFDPTGEESDREMMLQAYGQGGVQLESYETSDVSTKIITVRKALCHQGSVGKLLEIGCGWGEAMKVK